MKLPETLFKKSSHYYMLKRIVVLLFITMALSAQAQYELLCTTTILDNQIALSDKRIFRKVEQSITNFINSTRWTNEKFEANERIEINIQIIF